MYHALPSFSARGVIVGVDALIMGHYAPITAQCKPDRIGGTALGDAVHRDRPRKNMYKDPARARMCRRVDVSFPVRTSSAALIGYREFETTAGRLGADRGRQETHGAPDRNVARKS